MPTINGNNETIKYLTQDELARFFSKIRDRRDRAMFNIMYKHGLRASEVGLLKIDDVDLDRRGGSGSGDSRVGYQGNMVCFQTRSGYLKPI